MEGHSRLRKQLEKVINDMMGQDVTMLSTGKADMQCSFF